MENKNSLRIVGVAPGADKTGCVKPTDETIETGRYAPLSRPLYLYVNKAAMKKPQVATFLKYFLLEGQGLVGEVGYVRVSETTLAQSRQALDDVLGVTTRDAESKPAE